MDVFNLQSHPSLSEYDRRRLCKIMNCAKLSLDACNHAAQNDRLPMRTVMQVNTHCEILGSVPQFAAKIK